VSGVKVIYGVPSNCKVRVTKVTCGVMGNFKRVELI
jgi:hypothetical protein